MKRTWGGWAFVVGLLGIAGCGGGEGPASVDAAGTDGGVDAASIDAASNDAGTDASAAPDGGVDAAMDDAAMVDAPGCGNRLIEATEACDDGNQIVGDGCSDTCQRELGFDCIGQPSVCTATCADGVKASVEGCDDGNEIIGDGCAADCTVEPGFACEGTMPSVCASACGDDTVQAPEECDDGNLRNGDGCSWLCLDELNEVEPNNTAGTASSVRIDRSRIVHGTIEPIGDLDLFAVDVATAGVLRIEVSTTIDQECNGTVDVTLIDSIGTVILTDATRGIGNCGAITLYVVPGQYLVRVNEHGNDGLVPTYTLEVAYPDATGVEAEAAGASGTNDSPSTASSNVATGPDVWVSGDHTLSSDFDYYEVVVPPGASVRAEMIEGDRATESCESASIDSALELVDADDIRLADGDDGGRGLCSLIDGRGAAPLTAGARNTSSSPVTWYVRAHASRASSGGADSQFVYRLVVTVR